jgi:ribosomal protein S18 acetylase RimI-like enzyme
MGYVVRADRGIIPPMIEVRALTEDDLDWKRANLVRVWGSTLVARQGAVIDAQSLDGFVAIVNGSRVGLLTYAVRGTDVEVVTLDVEREGQGIGRSLMNAVKAQALEVGTRRLWLSTTNNNIRAFSFYQQWGMDLAFLIRDGVTASRAVKPSIPTVDQRGIPVRHELIFELVLVDRSD